MSISQRHRQEERVGKARSDAETGRNARGEVVRWVCYNMANIVGLQAKSGAEEGDVWLSIAVRAI